MRNTNTTLRYQFHRLRINCLAVPQYGILRIVYTQLRVKNIRRVVLSARKFPKSAKYPLQCYCMSLNIYRVSIDISSPQHIKSLIISSTQYSTCACRHIKARDYSKILEKKCIKQAFIYSLHALRSLSADLAKVQ